MQAEATAVHYSYLIDLVGHLSGLAHLRATQLCTAALSEIELTPKQFVALEFIAANPHISQKEIATHIGTAPPVVVGILDTLSARGFVTRIKDAADRRRHVIAVTEAGQQMRQAIKEAAFQVEEELFKESDLSKEEWDQLVLLMKKLTNRSNAF